MLSISYKKCYKNDLSNPRITHFCRESGVYVNWYLLQAVGAQNLVMESSVHYVTSYQIALV